MNAVRLKRMNAVRLKRLLAELALVFVFLCLAACGARAGQVDRALGSPPDAGLTTDPLGEDATDEGQTENRDLGDGADDERLGK